VTVEKVHSEGPPRKGTVMAASLTIEEEHGTSVGFLHPHNGYYAGDFRSLREHEEPYSDGFVTWSEAIVLRG
jgi:hypothetical protein